MTLESTAVIYNDFLSHIQSINEAAVKLVNIYPSAAAKQNNELFNNKLYRDAIGLLAATVKLEDTISQYAIFLSGVAGSSEADELEQSRIRREGH